MPPRNRHRYQPVIADAMEDGEGVSMVSEPQLPEFPEDHGDDGDDFTPKVEPRRSVSFDGGWDSKKDPDQGNTLGAGPSSQTEDQIDFRFRALDERTALRNRILEEKVGDNMRAIDDRFRSLEGKIDRGYEELSDLISRLCQEPRFASREADGSGRDETPLIGRSKGNPSQVRQATMGGGKSEHFLRRNQKSSTPFNIPGKLPMPKHPKVEIPTFRGEGDILNWLYQLEHVFAIHHTPIEDRVEFCVFFLQGEALLWWRWLENRRENQLPGQNSMMR